MKKMKKVISLIVIFMLISFSVMANVKTPTNGDNIATQFKESIIHPHIKGMNKEEVIFVSFTFNEDGYVKVISTNSSNEKLTDYVINNLEKIQLNEFVNNKVYNIEFKFILKN